MAQMVDEAEEAWLANAPPGAEHDPQQREQWEKLHGLAAPSMQPEEVSAALGDSSTQYHPLVRSCVGLARHSILLAANRLVARGQADGVVQDKFSMPMMGEAEPWMHELADSDLRGIFLSAPLALNFLVNHPEVIPARIPEEPSAAS